MVEINNFYFLLSVNFLVFFEKCKIFFNSLLVFKLELIFRALSLGFSCSIINVEYVFLKLVIFFNLKIGTKLILISRRCMQGLCHCSYTLQTFHP